MEDECRLERLKSKVELLTWLIVRECKCDRARCAEHFRYMEQLKFDYECQIEDYENENSRGDSQGA